MAIKGEALIRRAYTAFGERDLETLIGLSDEAIEVSTVTGLLAGRTEPYRGYEGLAEYMSDLTAHVEAARAPAAALPRGRRRPGAGLRPGPRLARARLPRLAERLAVDAARRDAWWRCASTPTRPTPGARSPTRSRPAPRRRFPIRHGHAGREDRLGDRPPPDRRRPHAAARGLSQPAVRLLEPRRHELHPARQRDDQPARRRAGRRRARDFIAVARTHVHLAYPESTDGVAAD